MALIGVAAPSAAQQLIVVEAVCAREVVAAVPQGIVDCGSIQNGARALLWTRLQGDADALEALAAGRTLDIVHRWAKNVAFGMRESQLARSIAAGGIKPELLEALRREVAVNRHFDWRTWTERRPGQNGNYTVWVTDIQGNGYPCEGKPSGCQLSVRVGG